MKTSLHLAFAGLFSILLSSAVQAQTAPVGSWSAAGSLTSLRSQAGAITLHDGRVLITGGVSGETWLSSAEIYDGKRFTAVASMAVARSNHAIAVLKDGRVLVTGGYTSPGVTNSIEIYDPTSNQWSSSAGMLQGRAGHTMTTLNDGRLLIAGGMGNSGPLATLEIYDPTSNSCTPVAVSMSSPRIDHAAAVLVTGAVLLAGGFDGSSVLNSVDAYDPKTGVMYGPRQMVSPRKNLSATTLIDGRVLLAGGNDGTQDLATLEVADLSGGTIAIVGSLTVPRSGHVAIALPNNHDVLITGGSSGGTPLASAELFSPANSRVRWAGNMSVARSGAVAAGSGSLGHVLIAGGESSGNTSTGDLYAFPTVTTDKPEYAPNTVVTITGGGWTPGETVTLVLHEQPTREPDITLTATADASGSFQNTSFKPDVHDERIDFVLTAEGQVSGVFAQTLFADSVYNTTLSLSSPASGGADSTINPSATLQYGVPVYQTYYYQYICGSYSCNCGWGSCSTCYYYCTGSYQEQVGTNYYALPYQPVQFSFNGGLQVTGTTDSNGIASASLIVPADATGLTVSYAGSTDGTYGPSTAVSNFAVAFVPSLLVTATSAYGTYGQPLPPLAYTMTGFLNGDTQSSATSGGPSEGTAASPTSTPGLYPIVISQGSLAAANYTFSFVTGSLIIQQAASTVSLTSLDGGIYPNQSTTLTATVSVTGSGAAPGGSVNFLLGATSLGTGALSPIDATDSAATLTLNGSQLAAGANSITAVYSSDANYGGSTSTATTVTLLNSQTNFGSANVGTAAPVQTLTYDFTGATTLSAVNILMAGASGLDYTDGGGSTCATGIAYSAGQSCVVTVAFTASVPGLRSGGVTLFAQGSNLPLMTWYLSGIGQSGAVTIDPGTQSTIATLSNGGQGGGTAIDGSGNVYVVDQVNSQVMELAAGSFTQTTVVSSGLLNPSAVALDGAGNLYVSDTGNSRVEMVPNENGTLNSADMSTVSISGLGSPRGLATDGSGNLYVVDAANGVVVEVPAGGGAPSPVASGLTSPYGVAVDAAGNAYVASSNQVAEYPVGGGTPIPMGSGYNNPSSLAVDASGAIYVADAGNARIVRVSAGGAPQANLAITGITNPQAVAVDGAGNVYVTDSGKVIKINRTQAAALVFASTSIGSTSTSQALTVSNAGNQLLTVSNLAITTNFTQVPTGASDCSSTTQLSPSGQCSIAVAFAPTASGTLTGTVALTDNSLNATSVTQSVALQGTQSSQTITFGALSNQVLISGPLTLSATASSGLAVSFASTTPALCTVSGATVTLLDFGTCTIQATQAGNANYFAATPVNQSFQVTQDGQTITFGALSNQALSTAPFTLSATGSSGLAVSFASTTPAVCTVSGATMTLVAAGTCTIQATQAGNANYAAATPVNQSFQVTQGSQTIAFGALSNQALSTAPFTLSATDSSGLAVSFASTTPAVCTVSGATMTLVAAGTCTIQATQPGNSNYGAATPVNQSFQVTPESQTVTFGALSNQTLGTAPFTLSATDSSGLAVSFASTTPTLCTVSGKTVTLVAAGTCTVQATQTGNTNYGAATPVNQSFQISDFALTSSSTTMTVTAGQPAMFTLTVTPQGSFTGAIKLACNGLPAIAGCTFTSATLTPNASTVTTALNITTAAHTTALALPPSDHRSSPLYAIWLLLPAMFLGTLGMAAPKGRKLLSYCSVFLLFGGCLLQVACGGGPSPGVNTTTGTPAGTYSVIVSGIAGSNQHTTTIKLTVH